MEEESRQDDPSRGIAIALLSGFVMWMVIFWIVYYFFLT